MAKKEARVQQQASSKIEIFKMLVFDQMRGKFSLQQDPLAHIS